MYKAVVEQGGRPLPDGPSKQPPTDGGSGRLPADGHSAPRLEGRSARPSACRGCQLPPDGLAIHPADGRKGRHPQGGRGRRTYGHVTTLFSNK
jgi:hypothetical protein